MTSTEARATACLHSEENMIWMHESTHCFVCRALLAAVLENLLCAGVHKSAELNAMLQAVFKNLLFGISYAFLVVSLKLALCVLSVVWAHIVVNLSVVDSQEALSLNHHCFSGLYWKMHEH